MQDDRIKVIYDSTWPARYYGASQMHGGLRVSYELLHRLISNPDLVLYFSINYYNEELIAQLKSFLFKQYGIRDSRIINRENRDLWSFIKKYDYLKRMSKLICSESDNIFDTRKLAHADIYHSPIEGIPNEIKKFRQIKTVFTSHDLMPFIRPDLAPPQFYDTLKAAYDSIDSNTTIIAVSESTKQDLLSYRTDLISEQVHVVHIAADENVFYINKGEEQVKYLKTIYNLSFDSYMLCLNRIQKYKNTQLVIDAYVKLVDEKLIKEIGLVLIGTFDDANTKSKMVETYSGYNIKFIEYVPEADLSLFYSNSVCFLYMSLFEGFGLPVLEAMQCGAPVVCSNAKSIPEVLGDSGICINPDSIDTLCENILKVLDDQELRRQMATKGIIRSKMFSWDKHASRVADIYKTLKYNFR